MTTLPISITSARLPTGLELPYIEQGDPDGVPMLLLHGITDSHRSFEPVLAALPDSIHAYAITQRGHGDASKPADGYAAASLAADAVAFLDAVGVERAVVVGHSMGAWIARRVAATYPDRVLGAVLAGCFSTFDVPEVHELLASFAELGDPIDPAYARAWQESTLNRPVPESYLRMIVEETCKPPARVWKAAMTGLVEDSPGPAAPVTVPTLLAWGDRDAFVPRWNQDDLLEAIPQAELLVHRGGGHAFHWEDPERFAAQLVEFAAML
jgi:pimeloyl-ACP methyl ester carboxylesterase